MNEVPNKRLRCAVYTRKSTAKGLEQDFNSIDSQLDACHAYIESQKSNGWIPVAEDYDDPAFSGGNTERPGLMRLLSDAEAGKIDVIVVYKLDRFTRSLFDFLQLLKQLEQWGVPFVSVTEALNTDGAMGRLVINVLMSFAQFQRELDSERIQDKFYRSRKNGYWASSALILGFDRDGRDIVVNQEEAFTIQCLFHRFLELGSVTPLVKELREDDVRLKAWTTKEGKPRGGTAMNKKALYRILNDRRYVGEVSYKDEWFAGRHPAIISKDLFEKVQQQLDKGRHSRQKSGTLAIPFLLGGLLEDADGRGYTTWSTKKKASNGRRYRYYLHQDETRVHAGTATIARVPAFEIENIVISMVLHLLQAPEVIKRTSALLDEPDNPDTLVAGKLKDIQSIWDHLYPAEQTRILSLIIEKIIIAPDRIDLILEPGGMATLLNLNLPLTVDPKRPVDATSARTIEVTDRITIDDNGGWQQMVTIPVRFHRSSGQTVIQLPKDCPDIPETRHEQRTPFQLALAKGHRWLRALTSGQAASISQIAQMEDIDNSYVSRLINLTNLAPDIVEKILDDDLPENLRIDTLGKNTPLFWDEQRERMTDAHHS